MHYVMIALLAALREAVLHQIVVTDPERFQQRSFRSRGRRLTMSGRAPELGLKLRAFPQGPRRGLELNDPLGYPAVFERLAIHRTACHNTIVGRDDVCVG